MAEFKTCSACGYTRHASDIAPDWECPKCQRAYAKSERVIHQPEIQKEHPPKGVSVEMDSLVIIHRKGRLCWLVITVLLIAVMYYNVYSGTPPTRVWILHVLAAIFIGFMVFSYYSIDSVEINPREGVALATVQILWFQKRTSYRLAAYSSVAVASFPSTNNRSCYRIGLRKADQTVDWVLHCWPPEFAWENTVKMARYLHLPVYDMLIKECRTWNADQIPATVKERTARINSR
jgi:hypothetical protein